MQKDTSRGSCCPSAIANALSDMYRQIKKMKNIKIEEPEIVEEKSKFICPSCGNELNHVNGCIECKNCGWSKCNL